MPRSSGITRRQIRVRLGRPIPESILTADERETLGTFARVAYDFGMHVKPVGYRSPSSKLDPNCFSERR
jgi:hypothetical protein